MQTTMCQDDGTVSLPNGQAGRLMGRAKNPLIIRGFSVLGNMVATFDESKVFCHECGNTRKVLNGHHLRTHGLTGKTYRIKYGLFSGAKLTAPRHTEKMRKVIFEKFSPQWRIENAQRFKKVRRTKRDRTVTHYNNICAARENQRGTCAAQLKAELQAIAATHGVEPCQVRRWMCRNLFMNLRARYKTFNQAKSTILGVPIEQCVAPGYRVTGGGRASAVNENQHGWTRRSIITAVKKFLVRWKRMPYVSDFDSIVYLPPMSAVVREFSTLNQLRKEMRLPIIVSGWITPADLQ